MKTKYGLEYFVETGSFYGDSTEWAANHFENVVTIEVHSDYHRHCLNRFAITKNVTCLLGDSRYVIKEVLDNLEEKKTPAFIFLDAHWGGGLHYRRPLKSCPVLDEIRAINEYKTPHVVMVDDARLFIDRFMYDFTYDWPTDEEVLDELTNGVRKVVTIYEPPDDCFIAEPIEHAEKD